MRNEKSGGRSGKGYYIALVLCAAAIGITSYVTRPSKDKEPDTPPLLQAESAETASSQETQALEALATEAPEESPVPSSAPQQTQPEKLRTAPPLSGSVTTLYAMDSLSYNETTRDWRVHNGVDYPGELGDPVSAAADGTVISVREDDSLGTTVVLRHTGGYETTYQNLEESVPVQLGDKVVLSPSSPYSPSIRLVTGRTAFSFITMLSAILATAIATP